MKRDTLSSQVYEVTDPLEAIEFYYREGMTDGLPVVPPTPQRVVEFLEHGGRAPDDVIGAIPARDRVVTAEKVAINGVMAGCLPEYMPVLLAAVEAMCNDEFSLNATSASTSGASHMVIVSGPLVKELDINFGVNLFGPTKRANATIGRAIRLILMNVCGAVPGVLDQSTLGNPGKYTSCIAEDEDLSPWPPLRHDLGYSREESTVTLFACYAPVQVADHIGQTAEGILSTMARSIVDYPYYARGGQVLVVIVPEHLRHIERDGWSKKQVKEYLFEATTRPMSFWKERPDSGKHDYREGIGLAGVVASPDDFVVLVAGGKAGGFSSYLVSWGSEVDYSRMVTRAVARI